MSVRDVLWPDCECDEEEDLADETGNIEPCSDADALFETCEVRQLACVDGVEEWTGHTVGVQPVFCGTGKAALQV